MIATHKEDCYTANRKIKNEIYKWYETPGSNDELGIHDIQYLTDIYHVLLTSFPKLLTIYTLVIRACAQQAAKHTTNIK